MKPLYAILFTLGLYFITFIIGAILFKGNALIATFIMVIVSSIWIAKDSKKINLLNYKSGISYSPIWLGVLCLLLWIIAFPWYLIVKYKITNSLAKLKDNIQLSNYPEYNKHVSVIKKCPYCAEEIKFDAVKCRFCGEMLNK